MRRAWMTAGILGLVVAAAAGAAPTQVTLFGQKYALERHPLGGQYKNGLTVVQPAEDDKTSTVRFVQGDTPENDRLFVGVAFRDADEVQADQFFLLTGADANGIFNPATSKLTEFFGGSQGRDRGGRIAGITWISDVDTGKQKDLNLALTTYTGDDYLRFYDEDTLTNDYISDAVLSLPLLDFGGQDTNMPYTGILQGAVLPDGNVLFIGRQDPSLGEGPQLGVLDIKNKKFFPVLTNMGPMTQDQRIPYDISQDPFDMQKIGENEYLILGADPLNRGADRTKQVLYKAKITPPADLANGKAESIQVEMEASETLLDMNAGTDPLGVGAGGIVGITAGRLAAPNLPRLYFSTRTGELITANPVLP
jgi:hypothetical protein